MIYFDMIPSLGFPSTLERLQGRVPPPHDDDDVEGNVDDHANANWPPETIDDVISHSNAKDGLRKMRERSWKRWNLMSILHGASLLRTKYHKNKIYLEIMCSDWLKLVVTWLAISNHNVLFQSNIPNYVLYHEIIHSNWLKLIMWSTASNHSALFQSWVTKDSTLIYNKLSF